MELNEQIIALLNNMLRCKILNGNKFSNEQELCTYTAGLSYLEQILILGKIHTEKLIEKEYHESFENEARGK